jgi:hypothetical protein
LDQVESVAGRNAVVVRNAADGNVTRQGGSVEMQHDGTCISGVQEQDSPPMDADNVPTDNCSVGADCKSGILEHIVNPSKIKDRKICRQTLKYLLVDGELYR